jgi:hypothetical protein
MSNAPYFDGSQLCLDVDADTFFSEKETEAKEICSDCHFIDECLEYALHNDVVGVWGGTDEKERAKIRKESSLPKPQSIHLIINSFLK